MKRLTQVLLSFGVGVNIPPQWLEGLGCGHLIALFLSLGIIITALTEWAYYPRNNK